MYIVSIHIFLDIQINIDHCQVNTIYGKYAHQEQQPIFVDYQFGKSVTENYNELICIFLGN